MDFVLPIASKTYQPPWRWEHVLSEKTQNEQLFAGLSFVLNFSDREDHALAEAVCATYNVAIEEKMSRVVTHLIVDKYTNISNEDWQQYEQVEDTLRIGYSHLRNPGHCSLRPTIS